VEKSARQRLLDQIRVLEDKASARDLEALEPLARDLLEQDDAHALVSLLLNLYLNPPEPDPAYAAGSTAEQPAEQVPPEPKAEKPPGQRRQRTSRRPRRKRR
jgi:hypothetical protein